MLLNKHSRLHGFFTSLRRGVGTFLGYETKDRRQRVPESERRQSHRIGSRNLIKILTADGETVNRIFNLVDLAEESFRFASSRPLRSNAILKIILNVCEIDRQIPMTAQIIWSGPSSENTIISHTAAFIVNMNDYDRHLLQTFVRTKPGSIARFSA